MRLHDPSFITFEGEAVLGRVPPRVLVNSLDGELSSEQRRGVNSAYQVFRAGVRLSVAPFHSQTRVLPDGTVVRMDSLSDQDTVYVTPPPIPLAPAGLLYGLNPAFWYNAPGVGDSMPDPVFSGTWVNLPYRDDLKSRERFWKLHPGNRTWRNTRDDSKTKGLVLSWWGLGKDRYTADWNEPSAAPGYAAFPYGKLFCNGELLHDFGSGTKAILGACICSVDDALTVSVVECDWHTDTYGTRHIRGYGAIGTLLDDGTGAASVQADTLLLRVHHAKLPGNFNDGAIGELTFTQIATPAIVRSASAGDPFTRDGDPYAFYSSQKPYLPPTAGIVFNSRGTEGALNINGLAYSYPSAAPPTIFAWGLRIDPRDGSLGEAITEEVTDIDETHASDPDGFFATYTGFTCTVLQARPVFGFDYEDGDPDDELVWVAHRTYLVEDDNDGAGGSTQRHFLQHSKYGVLRYDSYGYNPPILPALPVIDPSDNAVTERRWNLTGDLRMALTQMVGRNATDTLVKSFLEDTPLSDITEATAEDPALVSIALNTGYEGCDSSFDARMIVSRVAGQVQVYVDGADVTSSLTDSRVQDIRFPVLCGPIRSPAGVFPSIPDVYVAGAP